MQSALIQRSHGKCELCSSIENLSEYCLINSDTESLDKLICICNTCHMQINGEVEMDSNHWRCLNDSMWSEHRPVQIMSYRVLSLLTHEPWAVDLKTQMYLDEDALILAQAGLADKTETHIDSNGAFLSEGDNVTLIKDLVVKGANFTAKRGTMVRNISLSDNPEHIEGKVNGTRIVLVTKFLKKVND